MFQYLISHSNKNNIELLIEINNLNIIPVFTAVVSNENALILEFKFHSSRISKIASAYACPEPEFSTGTPRSCSTSTPVTIIANLSTFS